MSLHHSIALCKQCNHSGDNIYENWKSVTQNIKNYALSDYSVKEEITPG